jgi:putative Holliday junction resolvase
MSQDGPAVPLVQELPAGRLLALDVGDRRIGVAVGEAPGWLVRPLTVIERTSRAQDFARLEQVVTEQGAVGIVVGYPLNDDGTAGPQAQQTARYARRLAQIVPVPVMLWDERLSTFEADDLRQDARRVTKNRHPVAQDAVAAAVILQSYLGALRSARELADL